MFEGFLEDYIRRDKEKTAETYRKLLSQFEKHLNSKGNSGKFRKEDVLDFLKVKDWSNSTKNIFLAALSNWVRSELEKVQPPTNDEERKEVRRLNRIENIKGYDKTQNEKDPLSLEDIVDLRMIMDQDTKQIFWILSWFGLRYGELSQIVDINWEKSNILVKTLKRKDNHERTLYFDDYTGRILQNSLEKDLFDCPYSTMYKKFRRAGEKIRVELTPHICRHTFATKMGERTDPFTLAKMLGHSIESASPSKNTGKYVHPSQEKIKKLMLENHFLEPLEVK